MKAAGIRRNDDLGRVSRKKSAEPYVSSRDPEIFVDREGSNTEKYSPSGELGSLLKSMLIPYMRLLDILPVLSIETTLLQ